MSRLTFTAHFVICVVCTGAFSFSWHFGIPQLIWANDASYMTSAIAALVVGTAVWLGWQAWRADDPPLLPIDTGADSTFGQEAQLLAPALGMLGTVIGLSMTLEAAATAGDVLKHLSTCLFTTGVGILGFILLKVMTMNLEAGIKRAAR